MISLNPSTILNGDGIDVTSLVSQVLAQENKATPLLQQQQTDLQNQAGLLTTINSHLSGLSSAANSLADVLGPLSAMTVKSSQAGILTASAQPSAAAGTHTIVVNTLATQGTLYTDAVKDATTSILSSDIQSASIQFQVGGISGPTHSITISAGSNDTLTSLASYINNQKWGVTASVITDSTGARLAIYSNNSGSTGALAVTSNTSALKFNPAVGGTDANFAVDGIPFSSTTNTLTGAIPGVTLNLLGAYPGVQVQVAIAPDVTHAAQAINDFVSAYNTVINDLNQQFAVDPSTNSQGPLAGDSALRSLKSSLLSDATFAPGTGAYGNLRSLGITMNDDGTLGINLSTLTHSLTSDPTSVLNFFQNTGQTGFADHFAKDLRDLTAPSTGVLNMELSQNRAQQASLSDSLLDIQDRMAAEQEQLQMQYSAVNALLQSFPYQLQAIKLELGITPSGSNGSGS